MAITIAQMKAARMLLDWSQADLAKHANVSVAALNRIEKGITSAQQTTLVKLTATLMKAGIEFTPGQGVRLRDEVLETILWDGPDYLRRFQDDVLNTRLQTKEEALFCAVDEQKFLKADPQVMQEFFERVKKLEKQLSARERVLLHHGDRYLIGPPETTQYRWLPKEFKGLVPYAVYGSKVSFIFWARRPRVLCIQNIQLAQTFRQHFEVLWKLSTAVPFTSSEIKEIVKDNLKVK